MGQCYEFLSQHTVKKYLGIPIIEIVPQFLEYLTDEELKKAAKSSPLSGFKKPKKAKIVPVDDINSSDENQTENIDFTE